MLINHSFQVDQPIDQVWNFFDDVPLVAACVPGADLTKEVGEDQYEGDVTISAGPVKLEFSRAITRRRSSFSRALAPTRKAAELRAWSWTHRSTHSVDRLVWIWRST